MPAERPNILLFMTDHQRALEAVPGGPAVMPNLERLSREGMRFSEAYTPMALCAPARASLQTGVYPHKHRMLNNPHNAAAINTDLGPGLSFLGERVSAAGYLTAYYGKWHVGEELGPDARGYQMTSYKGRREGEVLHEGYEEYRRMVLKGQPEGPDPTAFKVHVPGYGDRRLFGTVRTMETRGDTYAVHNGVKFVREHRNEENPWFLTVSINAPHDSYMVSKKYLDQYKVEDIDKPPSFDDDLKDKPAIYRRLQRLWSPMAWPDFAEAIRHYYAYLSYCDEMAGRLLAALDGTGQAENTLFIWTSDHGDLVGAHRMFTKGVFSFDETYHIPMLIRWPGVTRAGAVCDEFVLYHDLAPTLVETAGGEPLSPCDGRSVVPLLKNEVPADWPKDVYCQMHGIEYYYTQRILKTREHKFVFNAFDMDEFYDLKDDPHETRNLIDDPACRDAMLDTAERLWQRMIEYDDYIPKMKYWTHLIFPRRD